MAYNEAKNLGQRLKAYNNSNTAAKKAKTEQPLTHKTVLEKLFTHHPQALTKLSLPLAVAIDFAHNVPAEDLLFFDLETTGLGSSEQTYPFLIGCATYALDKVHLSTLFADTPAGEEEILHDFVHRAQDKTLVSFNGKSFDLPLVLRRAEKYGIANRLKKLTHVDLFHTIRRIFPEKPARLTDAEERLLGFKREGDIRGAEVAQAYFEYLRFNKSELREAILGHNESDVLSLISLLEKVSFAFWEARAGKESWAYKIHRDANASLQQKKTLLESLALVERDGRDSYALGLIYRQEKKYRQAARQFLIAYRKEKKNAVVDLIRALKKCGHRGLAERMRLYALAREEERIQKHLV